jgi:RHS repeat-associated protein
MTSKTHITNYSPFGVLLQNREFTSAKYRYGFNGVEGDPEVKEQGNSYTTTWRQYDSRLGRWLSPDPALRKYPGWSPYVFAFNNPILIIDPEGDEPPWTIEDVQKNARKSNIVRGLETKIGLSNWKIIRDETNHQTRTDHGTHTIYLDHRSNLNQAILGYVWELTNASNQDRSVKARVDAFEAKIAKNDFVMEIFTIEAEAFINTALVSQELGINDPNYAAFNNQIKDFQDGKITKDDLVKQVAQYGYDNATVNIQGKVHKLKDVYGQQYEQLKKAGEDARKKEEEKNETPADSTKTE